MVLNHHCLNTNHRKMCHVPTQFNGHLAPCFPDEPLCERSRGVLLNQKKHLLPCQPKPQELARGISAQREAEPSSKASAHLVSSQVSLSAQPQVPCQAFQWGSSRSQFVLRSSSPPGLPLCTGTAG